MNIVNFKKAFVLTIPVFLGYIFLGMAFGILVVTNGFSIDVSFLSSSLIYAGSMQFALMAFLKENASLISILVMTFFINSRHMFYGLSLVERYNNMGKLKPYMIFSLTDETYALICSLKGKKDYENNSILFLISLLNQIYWVIGGLIGSIVGSVIPFNATGIDFAMTALFVSIVVDQYRNSEDHFPFYVGILSGIICLIIFKANNFLLPSLILSVLILIIRNKKL
ncbi:MAG: branched-chain amino acid ABC transporter permease [Erysipelotrichaceae bacterium]|nr:branched-chain amino acid ABC transporter permease [Erysipelotrichaceae bacterium]